MATLTELYRDHLKTTVARADRALAAERFDALSIHSGAPPLRFLDDQHYAFVPNPHFAAWVPLVAPHSWIVHVPGQRPKVVLVQPRDYWHAAPRVPDEEWVAEVDLIVVPHTDAARRHLPRGRTACIGDGETPDWNFAAVNPAGLLDRMHFERAVKTRYEIECLRRATALGVAGHRAAEGAFRRGASEYSIHLDYLRATGHLESELPYSNIIALDEHAAVLHYTTLGREDADPSSRRSFLIDAGAQYRGYACDITRTYAAEEGPYSELITALDAAQREIGGAVRAGTDYVDIHMLAHQRIAQILRDAGIVSLAAADAVDSGLSSVFFPHGIGHLIGLQVHDVGGFMVDPTGTERARPAGHPYLRLTRTLEPGFVVTIEPGIYFIPMLLEDARRNGHAKHINWSEVDRYAPYGGIRIEDDVVCTAGSPENLTRDAFAAPP